MLAGIAVAKALGPAGKGEYSLLQLLQTAAAGVTGNLGIAITYELTRQQKKLSELVKPLALILVSLSAIEWLAIGIWVWLRGPDPAPLLFAAAVPALIVLSWQGPIFLGLGWIRSLNVQSLYFAGGTFAAAIITLYVFRLGTVGAMWGWVASVWAIAISILIRTRSESLGTQTEPTIAVAKRLLAFGLRASAAGAFGFINQKVDSIATLAWLGTAGFGIYTVAVAAGEVLLRVSRSVAQAATKRVAAASRAIAARTVAKSNRASFAIIVAASIVGFIAAPWLVDTLYGIRFHAAADAIRILLPGIAAVSCSGILATFFTYQMGRPISLFYISIMNAVVETTLCVFLVPRYQMNGAALASTLTYLNAAAVLTWYFCKNSGLSPVEVWVPTLADMRTVIRAIRPDAVRRRSGDPRQIEEVSNQEFVVCGWTEWVGENEHFDALLLGVFDRGRLSYAGHAAVETAGSSRAELYEKLAALETKGCPFRLVPKVNSTVHWVMPQLVAEIAFGESALDGLVVHPVYVGLRADVRPEECVRAPTSG